jgi:predicted MPP superfamily phosphohydrolase
MVEEIKSYLKTPKWKRQHRWRRAIWMNMARLGLNGLHALPLNRRWVDIHRRPMPIPGLAPEFEGLRLVQLSDLHFSPVVWKRYLRQFVDWVNDLSPDLVVVTGDLITGGYRFAEPVARLLGGLKAPHGVICTFGNHDYGMYGKNGSYEGKRRADLLERSLERSGLTVLRNEVHRVSIPGSTQSLAIVGLDDEWSGHIDPKRAFESIQPDQPVICLNHNPANCRELTRFHWHWMLSGHTHGRQLATTTLGRRFNAHRRREFTHGYYCVEGRHLYVNRGLSYGQRARNWCRPEVTVFRLTGKPVPPDSNGNGRS